MSNTARYLGASVRPVLEITLLTTTNTINGHEYVDLGLSVKWATCDIGASWPLAFGDRFAWGETETKKYTEDNSATYSKDNDTFRDAAKEKWGGTWRMPTKAEFQELIDNCTWKWRSDGYIVTSNKNGNSIILPIEGMYYYWWDHDVVQEMADYLADDYQDCDNLYWSSSLCDEEQAYYLYFSGGCPYVGIGCDPDYINRYSGLRIRPVSE